MAKTPDEFLNPEEEVDSIRKISNFYKRGTDEIKKVHDTIDPLDVDRIGIQSEVDLITDDLDIGTKQWVDNDIPEMYALSALFARRQIKKSKRDTTVTFLPDDIDTLTVQNSMDSTLTLYQEALSSTRRNTSKLLDQVVSERIKYEISQSTKSPILLKELKQTTIDLIDNAGAGSLVDKAGRTWQLDVYADMVARTELTNITNESMKNQMAKEGLDLVVISVHGATDSCGPFEGQVFSLNGDTPGFDILDAATSGSHLFGPNCLHTYTPISLAEAQTL